MSGFSGASAAGGKSKGERIANPDGYVLTRTIEIAEALHARYGKDRKQFVVAVAVAEDAHGCSHKLISSNEGNTWRPDVRHLAPVRPDETLVDGFQHAERNIVSFVKSNGWILKSIGATIPVCPECQIAIGLYKIRAVTIEKEPT
jgi:hypothetical protein